MRRGAGGGRRGAGAEPRTTSPLERASRALALCGARRGAPSAVARDGEAVSGSDADAARVAADCRRRRWPCAAQDARRALEMLEPVRPYDRRSRRRVLAVLPAWSGVSAAEGRPRRRPRSSRASWIIAARSSIRQLYPLAHLGLARAAALAGDAAAAARRTKTSSRLWRDRRSRARRLVRDARQEYARLR